MAKSTDVQLLETTPDRVEKLWSVWKKRLVLATVHGEKSVLLKAAVLRMVRNYRAYHADGHKTMKAFLEAHHISHGYAYNLLKTADRIAELLNLSPDQDISDEAINMYVKDRAERGLRLIEDKPVKLLIAPAAEGPSQAVIDERAIENQSMSGDTADQDEVSFLERWSEKHRSAPSIDVAPRTNRSEAESTADSVADRLEKMLADFDYMRRHLRRGSKRYERVLYALRMASHIMIETAKRGPLPTPTYEEAMQQLRDLDNNPDGLPFPVRDSLRPPTE